MCSPRHREIFEPRHAWSPAGLAILVVAILPLQEPSSTQRPQFEAFVARVRVDVIVTDDEGGFVDDLRLEDFTLFEDGAQQEILDLQLVDLSAGKVSDRIGATAAPSAATDPNTVPTADPAVASSASASDLGAMIFLIDGAGLDPRAKRRFARAWSEWIEQTDELVVPRAAYAIASNGTLEELVPLTYEIEPFRAAADVIYEFPSFGTSVLGRMRELLDDMNDRGDRGEVTIKAQGLEIDEVARSLHTLDILTQLCQVLGARPGRTALVWVSMGVKLTRGGPYSALVGYDTFNTFALDRRIVEREEQLHQAANSANVSIYSIDPTLRSEQRFLGFDMSVGSMQLADLAQTPEVQGSLDGIRHSLQNAAIATGGQAYVQASDITGMLERIEQDSSRFYLLAYAPPAPRGDGQYREIRVEVSRPDVDVRARGGYIDAPAADRHTSMVSVALAMPGLAQGLPVVARVFRRWSPDGRPMVQLAVGLEVSVDQMEAGTAGLAGTWDHFHGRVLTDDDEIVEESHQEIHRIPGSFSDESSGFVRPFVHLQDWQLEPGTYAIHIALGDTVSGRLGATKLEVEVPEPSSEWSTSDLILAVGDGVGEPQPLVDVAFRSEETLLAYVEVSGGREPVMTGNLFNAEGTVRLSELPPLVLERDEVGLHRGAMRFQGLPPGEYTLQIMVSDPTAGQHRVFRERLHVVGAERRP